MQPQINVHGDTIEAALTKTARLIVASPGIEGHRLLCLLTYVKKDTIVHRNRVDLNFDQDRKVFARACESNNPIRLEKTLIWLSEQVPRIIQQGLKAPAKEISVLEREAGEAFLSDPDLASHVSKDLASLGVVGEGTLALTTYLVATSRLLPDPLWLILQGESSTGKSTIVNTVFRMVPEEQAENLTRLSPKAPFHEGIDLKHKLLLIQEREGMLGAQTALRTAKTEKRLKSLILQKGPDGRWRLERHHVEGPWAMITTTVPSRMDAQDSNRCIIVWTDSTRKHVEEILEAKKSRFAGEGLTPDEEEAILTKHRSAQRLLERFPVIIPYAKSMRKFPSDTPARARAFEQLCGLIEASALLHQRQRERQERNGRTCILADIDHDYALARRLFLPVLQTTVGNLGQQELEILHLCRAIAKDCPDSKYPIYRVALEKRTGLPVNTISDRLRRLEDAGLLKRDPSCFGGKPTYWKVVSRSTLLETPEELKANYEGFPEVEEGKAAPSAVSECAELSRGLAGGEDEAEELASLAPLSPPRFGRFGKSPSPYESPSKDTQKDEAVATSSTQFRFARFSDRRVP